MIPSKAKFTIVPLPDFSGTGAVNNIRPTQQQQVNTMDVISPEDRQKYIGLFNSFGPENNILSGKKKKEL